MFKHHKVEMLVTLYDDLDIREIKVPISGFFSWLAEINKPPKQVMITYARKKSKCDSCILLYMLFSLVYLFVNDWSAGVNLICALTLLGGYGVYALMTKLSVEKELMQIKYLKCLIVDNPLTERNVTQPGIAKEEPTITLYAMVYGHKLVLCGDSWDRLKLQLTPELKELLIKVDPSISNFKWQEMQRHFRYIGFNV